jgi:thiamine-phosphate pyrophosphorylase
MMRRYRSPMRARNRLPERFLFTDERMGGDLWPALVALPRGSGVIFRHYHAPYRQALLETAARICRRRGLLLIVAGTALRWAGPRHRHRGMRPHPAILTASAHSHADLWTARRSGAQLAFLSPVFATRSHDGAQPLGPVRFGQIARQSPVPVAALGGMTAQRYTRLREFGAAGWGAIDGLGRPNR